MKGNANLYNWYGRWTMARQEGSTLQALVWRQDNRYNSYMDGYKGIIIVYMCHRAAIKHWHTLAGCHLLHCDHLQLDTSWSVSPWAPSLVMEDSGWGSDTHRWGWGSSTRPSHRCTPNWSEGSHSHQCASWHGLMSLCHNVYCQHFKLLRKLDTDQLIQWDCILGLMLLCNAINYSHFTHGQRRCVTLTHLDRGQGGKQIPI